MQNGNLVVNGHLVIGKFTTTQRNAINPKVIGMEIYNSDTNYLEFWNGTAWISSAPVTVVQPCFNAYNNGEITNQIVSYTADILGKVAYTPFNVSTNISSDYIDSHGVFTATANERWNFSASVITQYAQLVTGWQPYLVHESSTETKYVAVGNNSALTHPMSNNFNLICDVMVGDKVWFGVVRVSGNTPDVFNGDWYFNGIRV